MIFVTVSYLRKSLQSPKVFLASALKLSSQTKIIPTRSSILCLSTNIEHFCRPHPKDDGRLCFQSVHHWGRGGVPPVWMGIPHLDLDQGVPQPGLDGGVPPCLDLAWGTPPPPSGPGMGYSPARFGWRGTPLSGPGMGYPPPPHLDLSIRTTEGSIRYVAFTQEDFLVILIVYICGKDVKMVHTQSTSSLLNE